MQFSPIIIDESKMEYLFLDDYHLLKHEVQVWSEEQAKKIYFFLFNPNGEQIYHTSVEMQTPFGVPEKMILMKAIYRYYFEIPFKKIKEKWICEKCVYAVSYGGIYDLDWVKGLEKRKFNFLEDFLKLNIPNQPIPTTNEKIFRLYDYQY